MVAPQTPAFALPFMLNFSSSMDADGSISKPGLVMPGFSHRCCVSMIRTAYRGKLHQSSSLLVMPCHEYTLEVRSL